jgi:hypothetical protein
MFVIHNNTIWLNIDTMSHSLPISLDPFSVSNMNWGSITKYIPEHNKYILNTSLFKNMTNVDMKNIIHMISVKTNDAKTGGWKIKNENTLRYIRWDITDKCYTFILMHKPKYNFNTEIYKSYGVNNMNLLAIYLPDFYKYKARKQG